MGSRKVAPDGSACKDCGDADCHAQQGVEEERGVAALSQHQQSVVAESGESGESAAQPGGQQQARFGGEVEACGQGVEQSDKETAEEIDGERCPREGVGEHPFAQCRLHAIAEDTAGAAADEYVYQCSGHRMSVWECFGGKNNKKAATMHF